MRKEMRLDDGRDRAFACAHCLHVRPEDDLRGDREPEPGPYCRNPLGVVHMDDCPVLLGGTCQQFVAREGAPQPIEEDTFTEVRDVLYKDYLRWTYWRRVSHLRLTADQIPKPIELVVEEKAEVEDEEIVFKVQPPAPAPADGTPASTPGAAPAGKPKSERFPGQFRSEDRRRKDKALAAKGLAPVAPAAAATGTPVPEEEDLGVTAANIGPKTIDEILAATPEARPIAPKHRPGETRGGRGAPRGRDGRRDRGDRRPAAAGDAPASSVGGTSPGAETPVASPDAGAGRGSDGQRRGRGRRRGRGGRPETGRPGGDDSRERESVQTGGGDAQAPSGGAGAPGEQRAGGGRRGRRRRGPKPAGGGSAQPREGAPSTERRPTPPSAESGGSGGSDARRGRRRRRPRGKPSGPPASGPPPA